MSFWIRRCTPVATFVCDHLNSCIDDVLNHW